MKTRQSHSNRSLWLASALAAVALLANPADSQAQDTAFTYQGKLENAGTPANGNFDFQFFLLTVETGADNGPDSNRSNVPVVDGVFTVELDFGVEITGEDRWLQITVRETGAAGNYTALSPRQKVTSAPYSNLAGGLPNVTVTSAGKVGVGTTNPETALQIGDYPATDQYLRIATAGGNRYRAGIELRHFADDNGFSIVSDERGGGRLGLHFADIAGANLETRMFIAKGSGNVGIGTTNPTAPLHVVGSQGTTYTLEAFLSTAGVADVTPPAGGNNGFNTISIRASEGVMSQLYVVESDARIKDLIGVSDAGTDLETLAKISVSDYIYTDKVAKGRTPQKKVIAQQVDEVFPQAVSKTTGVVADIFKRAGIKDGWISLATDLELGEKVKIITEESEEIYEVLETGDDAFRVELGAAQGDVFVYGREVDDFHAVDYDALSMLNISATQEIYRQLQAEQAKNSDLEKRLAVLEARDKVRDAKFAKLEKLLDSAGSVPVSKVIAFTAGGAE